MEMYPTIVEEFGNVHKLKIRHLFIFCPHPRTFSLAFWEGERKGERETVMREKHPLVTSTHTQTGDMPWDGGLHYMSEPGDAGTCPRTRDDLQPRYVSWLGMEPTIFWLCGQCSNPWATLAKVRHLPLARYFFMENMLHLEKIYM